MSTVLEGQILTVDSLPLRSRHAYQVSIAGESETVPVQVIVGHRHRPCLALVAGVHGNEYEGMVTLAELHRTLEPGTLQGSLILVPVANPFAFSAGQRRTPQDDRDLNRVFPGAETGTLSERLAHRLCTSVLATSDLVFTLHSAMADGVLSPWIEFLEGPGTLERATYAAALASDFPDLVALPRLPGVLQTALAERGVPVIEGEVGGQGTTTRGNVAYYTARILAVARHAGVMVAAARPETAAHPPPIWHLRGVDAETAGVFQRGIELRQTVNEGDLLGMLLDVRDGSSHEVRSPATGMIGGHRIHVGVRAGDRLVTLWERAE